jgi:hypothetical protein
VGRSSLLTLAFGVFFFDYDLDGYLDLFAANGHIEEKIGRVQPKVQYRQPPLLFRNIGNGKFENSSDQVGVDFTRSMVARGAAHADFDRDGDLDLLITSNDGPAYLYRNDGGNRNHWITIRTVGAQSNRDGIDAIVRVESASGKQWNRVRSSSSYCSQSDLALTFGLGQDTNVTAIEIEWPSGSRQKLNNIAVDRFLRIAENQGIVSEQASGKWSHH